MVRWRLAVCFCALCALLSACVAQGPAVYTPTLECAGAPECKLYWERAQVWVARNSHWKVQVATDVMISTFNGTEGSTYNHYTIVREPIGNGRERISMQTGCNNIFGCMTRPDIARRQLYDYVTSGSPASY